MGPKKPRKSKESPVANFVRDFAPRNSVRRVAIIFVVVLGVLLTISLLSGRWSGWVPITNGIAAVAGGTARALGIPATVEGNLIRTPTRTLAVDPQCTAVDLLAVYAALILAYPLKWKMRLVALVVGAIVLQVANIARLVGVAWAAVLVNGRSFDLVHDYLFEFAMVFVVMMMWAVWLTLARRTA